MSGSSAYDIGYFIGYWVIPILLVIAIIKAISNRAKKPSIINESKLATDLEDDIKRKVSVMKNPDGLTRKNLELQIYVLKKDIQRYKRYSVSKDPYGSNIDWKINSKLAEGILHVYEQALSDGKEKWLDKKHLKKQYDIAEKQLSKTSNKYEVTYYKGKMKAIAGLQKKQLFHSWTNPAAPISINSDFIKTIKEKGLL